MSYICAGCVAEPYLKGLVHAAALPNHSCEYCDKASAANLEYVAELCDEVIKTFYEESSTTWAVVHFDRTPAGHDLQTLIFNLTGIPQEAAEFVVEHLAHLWYDESADESRYSEDPWFVMKRMDERLSRAWRDMEESLRTDVRFFNPKAMELLATIFSELIADRDAEGQPVVVEAGPGTSLTTLFRGRVFQTDEALASALRWPERYLGPPAEGIGAPGRMNGRGQPAFYGATSRKTCIAEVRPPVGSLIAIAAFEIIRPLRLLDLHRLAGVEVPTASMFDPSTREAIQRRDFLRTLTARLSAPVLPELQDRDYLVTQAVADFLASQPELQLDGIVYPSAQRRREGESSAGDNVVLFRRACEVVNADGSQPTAEVTLYEFEEEGPGRAFLPEIHFVERAPAWYEHRTLKPSLALARDSIAVHEIEGVEYFDSSNTVNTVSSTSTWLYRG